jgi:predicted ferric reductase
MQSIRRWQYWQYPLGVPLLSVVVVWVIVQSIWQLGVALWERMRSGVWWSGGDAQDPLYELGTSLGFWGMVLFGLNFVLASRWQWVERFFGGLDRVYRAHGWLGKITLTLLVLHWAVLVIQAWPNGGLLIDYLIPGLHIGYTLGTVALALLVTLVILTIWVRLSYATWLNSHRWMGPAYLLGGLHAFVVQYDWYVALMTIAGGYAWVYRTWLYQRRAPHMYGVIQRKGIKQRITELVLQLDDDWHARPGQFVFFGVVPSPDHPELVQMAELHPFSLSQIIDRRTIRISVKAVGDYTEWLRAVEVGQRIVVYGPHGTFADGERTAPQIWLAGGIGITPFLSMLHAECHTPSSTSIVLFWTVRTATDAVYADEIRSVAQQLPHVRVIMHTGPVTLADVETALAQPLTPAHVLRVCGPPALMRALRHQWRARRLARQQFISEEFAMR